MFGKSARAALSLAILWTACAHNVSQDSHTGNESTRPIPFDPLKVEIPEPPKVAAIPKTKIPCDEFTFDPKDPACRSVCPNSNAPPGWPACKGKCPDPPDVLNSACWATRPPPSIGPRRPLPRCPPPGSYPDPTILDCGYVSPVTARVIRTEVQESDTLITIAAGSEQNVDKRWSGSVLRGESETTIDGGEVSVIRVGKRETLAKVRLPEEKIRANPRVRLTPPALNPSRK